MRQRPIGDIIGLDLDKHLVVEDLGLSGHGLGDQRLIENVENILAHLLELLLNLRAVFADSANVLVSALLLFLLIYGRNDSPRGTAGADNILVCHGQEVALVNVQLTTELLHCVSCCPSEADGGE